MLVLNPMRFGIDVERGNPDLYYRGKRLRDYDAVIPRIGASITFFGTAVIRQFEQGEPLALPETKRKRRKTTKKRKTAAKKRAKTARETAPKKTTKKAKKKKGEP